ncbi:hypothetical protein B0H14DRAFT_2564941 [Mycena olivaceomarginata]|nr:hypothetical protein B0H14DRAFT_2564941 [Mycena olivaceomarginata]
MGPIDLESFTWGVITIQSLQPPGRIHAVVEFHLNCNYPRALRKHGAPACAHPWGLGIDPQTCLLSLKMPVPNGITPAVPGSEVMCDLHPAMLGMWMQYRALELTNADIPLWRKVAPHVAAHAMQRESGADGSLENTGQRLDKCREWEGVELATLSSVWAGEQGESIRLKAMCRGAGQHPLGTGNQNQVCTHLFCPFLSTHTVPDGGTYRGIGEAGYILALHTQRPGFQHYAVWLAQWTRMETTREMVGMETEVEAVVAEGDVHRDARWGRAGCLHVVDGRTG